MTETVVIAGAGGVVTVQSQPSNETPVIRVSAAGPQGIQGPKGDDGAAGPTADPETATMVTDPLAYYILAKG